MQRFGAGDRSVRYHRDERFDRDEKALHLRARFGVDAPHQGLRSLEGEISALEVVHERDRAAGDEDQRGEERSDVKPERMMAPQRQRVQPVRDCCPSHARLPIACAVARSIPAAVLRPRRKRKEILPGIASRENVASRPCFRSRHSYLPWFSCIFLRTSSRLKLAAFWRCGYSLNVARKLPT